MCSLLDIGCNGLVRRAMEVEEFPALSLVGHHVAREEEEICDALGMTMDQVFKIGEEYVDGNSS